MINNETYIKILRTSTYYCGFKVFSFFHLDTCIYYCSNTNKNVQKIDY